VSETERYGDPTQQFHNSALAQNHHAVDYDDVRKGKRNVGRANLSKNLFSPLNKVERYSQVPRLLDTRYSYPKGNGDIQAAKRD